MGNTFNTRTPSENLLRQRHVSLTQTFNQWQTSFIHEERQAIEVHCQQLYSLASHVLSEADIKTTAQIGVLCQLTLQDMRKLYVLFSRMASTTERFTTIHEISLYFNVRRTVLLETCLTHVFPGRERLSLPEFLLTMMAFCTCDHHELIRALTNYCADRNESSLENVLIAVHGAPLKGNIEALLIILQQLETVNTDVTLFDKNLQRPCANVNKLVDLNNIYPSLLYPSFKLQAGIKEKCLGNHFWNRLRTRLSTIGIVGMFSLQDWKNCELNYYSKNLLDRSTEIMLKNQCTNVLPMFLQPGLSPQEKMMRTMEKISNFRPYKSASVVDMSEDNSEGWAWEISATNIAKSASVEMYLNEEEEESRVRLEEQEQEQALLLTGGGAGVGGRCHQRVNRPGNPQNWIELTEGIYSKQMWRWMSTNGGYSVSKRIQQGCVACEKRANTLNIGLSTMLKELASVVEGGEGGEGGNTKSSGSGKDTTIMDAKTLLAKANAEQRMEDQALEKVQRESWDLFWRSFIDPRTKRPIYFNFLTGERSWIKPRGMNRRKKDTAKRRRRNTRGSGNDGDGKVQQIKTRPLQQDADMEEGEGEEKETQEEKETEETEDENNEVDQTNNSTVNGRASPPSLKEQGLTPKERKRMARSDTMNKTKYLLAQTWGLEAAIQREKKHAKELLGSTKSRRVQLTATGEINENVTIFVGDQILIVTGECNPSGAMKVDCLFLFFSALTMTL